MASYAKTSSSAMSFISITKDEGLSKNKRDNIKNSIHMKDTFIMGDIFMNKNKK